jgi:hypothetical protein
MVVHVYHVQREHETHRKRRCISSWHMQCEDVAEISMLATLLQTLLVVALPWTEPFVPTRLLPSSSPICTFDLLYKHSRCSVSRTRRNYILRVGAAGRGDT